jgi:hypothetical protein
MSGERVPLAVEQDTPEVQHHLGATTAPAHAGTIETHADQIANSTFGRAGGDVEVRSAEFVIAHVVDVLGQVLKDREPRGKNAGPPGA